MARYQQFRAIHRAVDRLQTGRTVAQGAPRDERGGIIWHTQGSGKSLSMVFLVRKIRMTPALNASRSSSSPTAPTWKPNSADRAAQRRILRPTDDDNRTRESPTARTQRILSETTPDIVFAMLQKYQESDRRAAGGRRWR